jgi:hypothetical protein
MSKKLLLGKFGVLIASAALVAGCATTAVNTPQTPAQFDKSMADADAIWHAGQSDKAIGLYEQIAKTNPTREEPWSRIAQIQFAATHYGQAIVAAQEALQRDNTDRSAKSVLAVSGLRIATESLGELRDDSSLAGDARTDAQALAKMLRDTLGEDTLFPPEQEPAKPVLKKRRRIVRHVAPHPVPAVPGDTASPQGAAPAVPAAPVTPAPRPATPAPAAARPAHGGADPFSSLR